MAKKSKMTNFIVKGVAAVCTFLASMMLICPVVAATMSAAGLKQSTNMNLFDIWDNGLKDAPADYTIMTICFSIVFFLGLIMAILFVLNMFLNNQLIDKILMIAGIAFAVLAVVGLICAFVYGGSNSESVAGMKVSISAGVGAILATIFSVAAAAMTFAEKSLSK